MQTMIPARRSCPIGWTREYEGYLMSSYVSDMKMTYQCVDANPDVISGKTTTKSNTLDYYITKWPHCV